LDLRFAEKAEGEWTVQKNNILIVLISAFAIVALIFCLAYVWPESGRHQGTRDIYNRIQQAKLLWRQAQVLLRDPVYTIKPLGGEAPEPGAEDTPPMRRLTATDEVLPMPDAVNPKAWQLIAHADMPLAEALAMYPQADPAMRAQALDMLAAINETKGAYHAERAAIARRQADLDFLLIDDILWSIDVGIRAMAYQEMLAHNALEGMTHDQVVSIREKTSASLEMATDELNQAKTEEQDLRQQVDQMVADKMRLAEEAEKLRNDSKNIDLPAERRRDLLTSALGIETQINEIEIELDNLARAIEFAQHRQALAQTNVDGLTRRIEQVDVVLSEHSGEAENKQSQAEIIRQDITKAQQELRATVEQLQVHCDLTRQANAEAIGFYLKALGYVDQALSEAGGDERWMQGRKGQLLAMTAKAKMDDREVQGRLDAMVKLAHLVYVQDVPQEIAGQLAQVQAYTDDPAAADSEILDKLRDAADSLERALPPRGPERPAYLGQLADVYFMLYQITADDSDRSKAEDRLRDARAERKEELITDPLNRIQAPPVPTERQEGAPLDDVE